ncbi:uncharacterized protein LOC123526722 [Mercenaria mercenaria]|uniref:uncharacterized protein LOC123526722 n=1 Tax=Mercenaria mercenaria TaxID=6596 RepID=UPI001E1D34FE|nr:uncharacterized protein LOC123526722 [Mercenaria mercenaria]
MVRAYLVGEQEDWDLNLGCLAGAYRSSPNESTGLTPNLLCMGREIRMPADLVFGHYDATSSTAPKYGDYVQGLRDKMLLAHEVARKNLSVHAKRSKDIYDSKLSFHTYHVGDLVWCLHETKKVGVMPKLQKAFDGPFVVKEKRSELNYVLQLNKEGKERVVHHNKLKKYEGTSPPKWATSATKKLKESPLSV